MPLIVRVEGGAFRQEILLRGAMKFGSTALFLPCHACGDVHNHRIQMQPVDDVDPQLLCNVLDDMQKLFAEKHGFDDAGVVIDRSPLPRQVPQKVMFGVEGITP